ncbi:hypothetical protein [Citrobacter freundii]|uniref:hypothetical protein n=1 Tax=Citrobacter freundii TaxID=546 RepID=UPI00397A329C
MKKTTRKQRLRIKRYNEKIRYKRKHRKNRIRENSKKTELAALCVETNKWIDNEKSNGLILSQCPKPKQVKNNMVVVHLPEQLDLDSSYDQTLQALTAIRKLVVLLECFKGYKLPKSVYKIGSINFDKLKKISTSTALILTSEIARWDSGIRKKLVPQVDKWDDEIYHSFSQLGFFELFKNKPTKKPEGTNDIDINYVKYFKGSFINKEYARSSKRKLKSSIIELVGNDVPEWTFLHSGLSEAVTNVTHHAYPDSESLVWNDKSWYLTGSFNTKTRKMTISFFDQGIGIPNSLSDSTIWEAVLKFMDKINLPAADRKLDSVLLKAAVNIDRTRTGESDRGKGLQDLLEFIKQRNEGSLSIHSQKGSYTCEFINGKLTEHSKSYQRPLCGTLITWSVTLEKANP